MPNKALKTLLREEGYDQDPKLLDSGTDDEFDTDADETYDLSHVPNDNDRSILNDAQQQESFLAKPSRFTGIKNAYRNGSSAMKRSRRRNKTRARRLKEDAEGNGSSELIYEMESGYKDNSSRSSTESLALLNEKWKQEPRSSKSFLKLLLIGFGIAILFSILAYGSYRASHQKDTWQTYSNGTHVFGPTTILISLDGFRADFLHRGLTPAMKAFTESGVSPEYMLPSFPSLTFPNHFTLVTGLYPESHGIVGNQFWDPVMQEEFYYTDVKNSMQPKWWNAEPLWVTVEKAGLKTAIHMWPGSEAHVGSHDPTYLDKYNGSETLDVKVNRILQWLDMPTEIRPQLIGAYVPNVDADGHKFGPNSTEIRATIAEVDGMLTTLVEGLFKRNLTEVVNLVIVSDHGMATTSNDRLIQLDDFIDLSLVDHIDGWPLRGLRLKNPERDLPLMYEQLLTASKDHKFDVYTTKTMPERYHFSTNDRIAPLWVIPHVGWAVVEKEDFDVLEAQSTGKQYEPRGLHGYDHEHPLMRAIFVARGPAFPHLPNSRVAPFQNIEVYNIVCDSLGIQPHRNNGTLRLPLTTVGLHSDFQESVDIPADPVIITSTTSASPSALSPIVTIETDSLKPTQTASLADEDDTPIGNGEQISADESKTKHGSWWDFLHNQITKAKEWAKELVDSIRNNNPSANTTVE